MGTILHHTVWLGLTPTLRLGQHRGQSCNHGRGRPDAVSLSPQDVVRTSIPYGHSARSRPQRSSATVPRHRLQRRSPTSYKRLARPWLSGGGRGSCKHCGWFNVVACRATTAAARLTLCPLSRSAASTEATSSMTVPRPCPRQRPPAAVCAEHVSGG